MARAVSQSRTCWRGSSKGGSERITAGRGRALASIVHPAQPGEAAGEPGGAVGSDRFRVLDHRLAVIREADRADQPRHITVGRGHAAFGRRAQHRPRPGAQHQRWPGLHHRDPRTEGRGHRRHRPQRRHRLRPEKRQPVAAARLPRTPLPVAYGGPKLAPVASDGVVLQPRIGLEPEPPGSSRPGALSAPRPAV